MTRITRSGTPLALSVIALGLLFSAPVQAQQVLARVQCEGTYLGVRLQGYFVVERWLTARSYRYYGRLEDPSGNVIELEVFSASNQGTGGAWTNGMRHRETHLSLTVHESGFTTTTEDGVVSQFACKA